MSAEKYAHEDCRALHLLPAPYVLMFTHGDGETVSVIGGGREPFRGLDSLDFIERQVLAATCRGIVREVERLDVQEPTP